LFAVGNNSNFYFQLDALEVIIIIILILIINNLNLIVLYIVILNSIIALISLIIKSFFDCFVEVAFSRQFLLQQELRVNEAPFIVPLNFLLTASFCDVLEADKTAEVDFYCCFEIAFQSNALEMEPFLAYLTC
jgi:hypothetical protein